MHVEREDYAQQKMFQWKFHRSLTFVQETTLTRRENFTVGANVLSDCNGCAGEIEIMKSYIRYSFVSTFPHFKTPLKIAQTKNQIIYELDVPFAFILFKYGFFWVFDC